MLEDQRSSTERSSETLDFDERIIIYKKEERAANTRYCNYCSRSDRDKPIKKQPIV